MEACACASLFFWGKSPALQMTAPVIDQDEFTYWRSTTSRLRSATQVLPISHVSCAHAEGL
jgi:hypothetical protein